MRRRAHTIVQVMVFIGAPFMAQAAQPTCPARGGGPAGACPDAPPRLPAASPYARPDDIDEEQARWLSTGPAHGATSGDPEDFDSW